MRKKKIKCCIFQWGEKKKTKLGTEYVKAVCCHPAYLTHRHGYEFEQAPGVGDGQGSLACCSLLGPKVSDTTFSWEEKGSGDWVQSSIVNDLINHADVMKTPKFPKRVEFGVLLSWWTWGALGRTMCLVGEGMEILCPSHVPCPIYVSFPSG